MGMKEDIKEMYRQLGIMDERVRQVENLTPPKRDEIEKDLAKSKNEKEFDKKKKDWQGKVDKADATLKDADTGFDKFTDQIKKIESANNSQYQDTSRQLQIEDRIKQAEDADKALKQIGQPSPFGPMLSTLNTQRQQEIDRRKQLYNEVKQETTAMWKLYDDAWAKYTKVKRGDLSDAKDFLKTATFGSAGSAKSKGKLVKAR